LRKDGAKADTKLEHMSEELLEIRSIPDTLVASRDTRVS